MHEFNSDINNEYKDILLDLIQKCPNSLYRPIKTKYPNLFDLINIIPGTKFTEKVYNYLYIRPICICGSLTPFINIKEGYHRYCLNNCEARKKAKLDKMQETCMLKYGVSNYSQTKEFKQLPSNFSNPDTIKKIKETKLKKYGDSKFNNRDKCKETKLERYHDEKYCNKDQIIRTNQERYNANSFTATELGKETVRKTIQERYDKFIFNIIRRKI